MGIVYIIHSNVRAVERMYEWNVKRSCAPLAVGCTTKNDNVLHENELGLLCLMINYEHFIFGFSIQNSTLQIPFRSKFVCWILQRSLDSATVEVKSNNCQWVESFCKCNLQQCPIGIHWCSTITNTAVTFAILLFIYNSFAGVYKRRHLLYLFVSFAHSKCSSYHKVVNHMNEDKKNTNKSHCGDIFPENNLNKIVIFE